MCSLGPHRLGRFGRWKLWLVAAGAFAFFGVSSASCGGADQEALPVPEGAEEKSRTSNTYSLSEMSGPDGYSTNVVYTIPEGSTGDEVLRFYEDTLGEEWKQCRHRAVVQEPGVLGGAPPPPPESVVVTETFYRDGVLVSILVDGPFPETYVTTIELAVDLDAFWDFCTAQFSR